MNIFRISKQKIFVFVLVMLLVSACTTNEPEKTSTLEVGEVTFRGAATKGPLSNSNISVYAMDVLGNKTGASLAQTTSINGSWTITVSNPNNELLLVEADGGDYIDESDSEPDITKKRKITLQAGETLQGILVPGQTTAAINFFTYTLVESMRKELSSSVDLVQAFNRVRSRAFNALGFDPFVEVPTDPITPDAGATATEKAYALLIGGAAYAINNAAIETGETQITYNMIDAMVKDFADCRLDGVINGISVATLLSFPVGLFDNISINDEVVRFRNNHYDQYTGITPPVWDDVAFCETNPTLSRVLPSNLIDLSFSTGTLEPAFSWGNINYNLMVPYEVASITLTPTADTLSSTITVGANAVISGQVSAALNLAVGDNVINIVVLAEDGLTETQVIVNINRNDPPVFSTSSSISVQEKTEVIGNVVALDNDGGSVTYSISGGADASYFAIDSVSGALKFITYKNFEAPIDADMNNIYLVDIIASDSVNTTPLSMAVTVTDINDELPVSVDTTVAGSEDTNYVFLVSDFSFSDLDAGNTLNQIQITSLESVGSLKLSGVDVLLSQIISFADINSGNLQFSPISNANGVAYDSFSFKVHDGLNYSLTTNVVTIDVAAVNDIPIAVDDTFYTIIDQQKQFTSVVVNDSDLEDGSVTVDTYSTTSAGGGTITSPSDGIFIYTPPASYTGTDSFTYTVKDTLSAISIAATVNVKVSLDSDGDVISDLEETEVYGTFTNNIDSDGDTFTDFHEITAGTLPLDNFSFPAGTTIDITNNAISTSVTWTLAGSPYWVQNPVTIDTSGSLTIQPGVVVKFDTGQSITVNSGGSLTAFSDYNFPGNIRFTSIENDTLQGDTSNNGVVAATAGDWTGIISNSGSSVVLNRINLEFATTGLDIVGSNPTLHNSSINNSLDIGLAFKSSASGDINTVTIDGAGLSALLVEENVSPSIFSLVTLSNAPTSFWLLNRTDFSALNSLMPFSAGVGLGTSYISLSGILPAGAHALNSDPLGAGSVWYLPADLEIAVGATLDVDDGVVIKALNIGTDINVLGTLNLNGSILGVKITSFEDDNIAGDSNADSTATSPNDQSWAGINYRGGSAGSITNTELWYGLKPMDIENTLPTIDGLTIKFAGHVGMEMVTSGSGSIGSTPIVRNLTIDDTDNHALFIDNSSTVGNSAVFENLNISNPGSPGLNFNAIRIQSTGVGIVNPSFGINAGVSTINGSNGGGINSTVSISGTNVNPTFDSLTINGGLYNFYAENNATATVTSTTLDNAALAAIYMTTDASPSFYSSNTISNTITPVVVSGQNFSDPGAGFSTMNYTGVVNNTVELSGVFSTPLSIVMEPLGTGTNFVINSSATFSSDLTLEASSIVSVSAGAILTFDSPAKVVLNSNALLESFASSITMINSGIFFKLDASARMDWQGDFYVNGSASSKVVFTSLKDDYLEDTNGDGSATIPIRGDWGSITCSATCDLTHADIRYATTGLVVAGGSYPTILNSLFDFNNTGMSVSTTGVLNVSLSTFTNNQSTVGAGGIDLIDSASLSTIKHNYFRANTGVRGGALNIQSVNNPDIYNNLFVENTTTLGGGAVDFSALGSGVLTNNTITKNKSSELNMPGGVYVADNANNVAIVKLDDNIIWNNINNNGADVNIDFVVADVTAINDVVVNNNVTKDASLTAIGTANITAADVFFDEHYYLATTPSVSSAIDAGSVLYSGSLITNDFGGLGTTAFDGTADSGTVDMGYHHSGAALIVDVTQSSIIALNSTPVTATAQVVQFRPMDASAVLLGPLWNVSAAVTTGNGVVGLVEDRGDGSYTVIYTSGTSGSTDIITFTIDGITQTVTFNVQI